MASRLVAVVALLGLLACGHGGNESARTTWEKKKPAHYQFVFRWSCFCTEDYISPTRVEVKDGVIASAVDVQTGAVVDPQTRNLRTIDGLFDFIDDAYSRSAATVQATYNTTDGHPETASIDYRQMVADDEISFTVTELQTLP